MLVGGAGLFLVALDFSINVSLPTMRDSLGASLVTVQWIIILYHATRSGTGFGAGGIGDRFGLKRLFVAGVVAYTLTVGLISLQGSLGAVVSIRLLQGIGAGALFIAGPALVARAFGRPRRGTALGVTLAALALGQVTATLGGGWLSQNIGWQAIFWARVPIGAVVLIAAFALPKDERRTGEARARQPFDWTGAGLLFAAMFLLILALSFARLHGWLGALPVGLGAASAVLLLVSWAWQARAANPILPPRLLRLPAFRAGAVSNLLATVASFVMWFLFPFYVADALGRGPLVLGALLAAMSAAGFVGSSAGGWLADRIGDRRSTFAGAALTAAGLASVGTLGGDATVAEVVLRVALVGFGFGFHQGAVYALTMRAAPREHAGAGAAMLAVAQTIGTVASIAIMTSVLAWRRDAVAASLSDTGAFLEGYRYACLVAAGVAVAAGACVISLSTRMPRRAQGGVEPGDGWRSGKGERNSGP